MRSFRGQKDWSTGFLKQGGMPSTGKKNMVGSMHGLMNHEYLNDTSSALLAAQQCNSDVQLPYRLPICETTHSSECSSRCWESCDAGTIIEAVQRSQDAQAGYACDYFSKRQPMAFNEVKGCCKRPQDLEPNTRYWQDQLRR